MEQAAALSKKAEVGMQLSNLEKIVPRRPCGDGMRCVLVSGGGTFLNLCFRATFFYAYNFAK